MIRDEKSVMRAVPEVYTQQSAQVERASFALLLVVRVNPYEILLGKPPTNVFGHV